jgi:hypothetical protein
MLWMETPPAENPKIMQDKNNLQIADLILKWIDAHAAKGKRAAK